MRDDAERVTACPAPAALRCAPAAVRSPLLCRAARCAAAPLLLLLCALLQMSGSNKKIAIDELQHARKVKRSGTSGSKKVAKGGSAVAELAEAIAKLSDGARTNSVIESYNKLVKHYDGVILVRAQCTAQRRQCGGNERDLCWRCALLAQGVCMARALTVLFLFFCCAL